MIEESIISLLKNCDDILTDTHGYIHQGWKTPPNAEEIRKCINDIRNKLKERN